ncbi:D-inositol-3-phosphate glycosyltransferase [Pirellula sp. SH-Sr6A]|uniref:glycosyltransferase family 4 protein n=1 Tax=Pirellula sp. SH-Sr6A TaxID=1632865 RepID=UPI00078E5053|nr:glycosyltransferase family 4 protein [Pirellula sp. SH-Sr6A]AMV31364.1 D-inositol-3-phosphate glycosyltransferase [Pirellula sp. SH-Sr6A]
MKIYVVNNMIPFLHGGAEDLANYLISHLRRVGHVAELLRIPFRYEPAESIYSEMLACRMMRIGDADLVIALKFPAYLIPHPNKVLWLVHQYRQAYDMWDSGYSNIPATEAGQQLRGSIKEADAECFRSVQRLYTISPVTQKRLKKYNQFESELLRTPINGPEDYVPGEYGDYIFCGGRINSTKRQHLLIEAMQHVRSDAKLLIAGPADSPQDSERLERMVEQYGLEDRVILRIGYHDRAELVPMMCNSLACAYLPIDEDSYGYVTMEANQAGKAVLTVNDSGGLLDLVLDDQTGWVRDPDPLQVAEALDLIFTNRQRTVEMGAHARHEWLKKEITWERTVERLVA